METNKNQNENSVSIEGQNSLFKELMIRRQYVMCSEGSKKKVGGKLFHFPPTRLKSCAYY